MTPSDLTALNLGRLAQLARKASLHEVKILFAVGIGDDTHPNQMAVLLPDGHGLDLWALADCLEVVAANVRLGRVTAP